MTVTASLVRLVYRPFPLGDTDEDFVTLSGQAKKKLDRDNPGIPSEEEYDRCHALLIAHMYQISDPQSGLKSWNSGDFSGSQDPGVTAASLEYDKTLAEIRLSLENAEIDGGTGAVERSDAAMPELQLDAHRVPRFGSDTEPAEREVRRFR